MASQKVQVGELAAAVMEQLAEYSRLAADSLKDAVRSAGKTVRKEIRDTAPKDTGAYGKSWSAKATYEDSRRLEVTVHSRNRYQLAHLLEFGHARRGGGRTAARPHIAKAEELGVKQLERDIERSLRDG